MTDTSAVPPTFRLPWNTTVTMADVWAAASRATHLEARRLRAQRMHEGNRERNDAALSDRKVYRTRDGKPAFAGYDERESGL